LAKSTAANMGGSRASISGLPVIHEARSCPENPANEEGRSRAAARSFATILLPILSAFFLVGT
jgi:hypothetical protein